MFWNLSLFQATVKVMQLFSDEIETESAGPGENLKLKVSGVEEEVCVILHAMIRPTKNVLVSSDLTDPNFLLRP